MNDSLTEELPQYYNKFEIFPEFRDKNLILPIGKDFIRMTFDILIEDNFLFTATIGKGSYVKKNKDIDLAQITNAMDNGLRIIAEYKEL